jgi:uncharacterized DUF497 family protein
MTTDFAWDGEKDKDNQLKHGVSFDEAKSVFYDDMASIIDDPDHSEKEDRFVILGMSNHLRVLIVVHCYRENDDVIRIISARKASKQERKGYRG